MVIQERDRHLLRELSLMRVVTREQAQRVAGFHSTTRANVRLLKLTNAGLLRRFFLGSEGVGRKALYALTRKGAQLVDVPLWGPKRRADSSLVADFPVEHQLEINEIYSTLKYASSPTHGVRFHRWIAFGQTLAPSCPLIPDGYVEFAGGQMTLCAFLEIDRGNERSRIWQKKAENYAQLALSGDFSRQFSQQEFQVLVVGTTERKLRAIRKAVVSVTDQLFWFATLEKAKANFFGPIWWPTVGEHQVSLFSEP